jgi:hypothetical protein
LLSPHLEIVVVKVLPPNQEAKLGLALELLLCPFHPSWSSQFHCLKLLDHPGRVSALHTGLVWFLSLGGITQNLYRCVLLHLFSEMHKIEGLKLVLYRISIENNKKISCHAQKNIFDTF